LPHETQRSRETVWSRYGSYSVYTIPKRRGGFRVIEAPDNRLKNHQRRLLQSISGVPISPFSYGVARGTHAAAGAHFGCDTLIKVDVQDFFGSISVPMLRRAGVHRRLAHYASLSAYDVVDLVSICRGAAAHLPQGSPTSPLVADLYMLPTDYGIARDLCRLFTYIGVDPQTIAYTRYIDDLIISIAPGAMLEQRHINAILSIVQRRVKDRGLHLATHKTTVRHSGSSQVSLGYCLGGQSLQVARYARMRARKTVWKVLHGEPATQRDKALLAYATTGRLRPVRALAEAKDDYTSTAGWLAKRLMFSKRVTSRDMRASVPDLLSRGLFQRWRHYSRDLSAQDVLDASMAILSGYARLHLGDERSALEERATRHMVPLPRAIAVALGCVVCAVRYPKPCRNHS